MSQTDYWGLQIPRHKEVWTFFDDGLQIRRNVKYLLPFVNFYHKKRGFYNNFNKILINTKKFVKTCQFIKNLIYLCT